MTAVTVGTGPMAGTAAAQRQPRPFGSRVPGWRGLSPFARDCAAAGVFVALGLLGLVVPLDDGESTTRSMDALGIALMMATAVPVAWRRVNPTAAAVVGTTASVVYTAFDYGTSGSDVALLVLLYSLAAYSARRRALVVATVLIAAVVGQLVLLLALGRDWVTIADPIAAAFFLALPAAIGDNRRIRRAYVASLIERAEQAELVRRLEAARAVADERTRIARELHDVVAHHVTGIVVFAGVAERHSDALPVPVQRSLAQIRASGSDALAAMRELVTVLRSGSEAAAAGLGVAAVRDLVERAAAGGADVRLDVAGFDDSGELPPEVATCLFRLVQESLTNATKYAPGAAVSVRLHRAGASLDVAVDNVAAEVVTAPALPSGGHGLVGMRERVQALGGTVTAGPAAGGGWSVRARIPLT